MKKIFAIILYITIASNVIAQSSGWFIQYDATTNTSLFSIYFTNKNVGWVVGDQGTILKTTNGGISWSKQNSAFYLLLRSVYFINENVGWVVGDQGAIFKTTNGGDTWIKQVSGTDLYLSSIHFYDKNYGITVGGSSLSPNAIILRTTDGGINWIKSETSIGGYFLTMVQMTDSLTAWTTGYYQSSDHGQTTQSSKVFKSNNGGKSWVYQTIVSGSALFFINKMNGWIIGAGTIYKTTDDGNVWTNLNLTLNEPLNSIFFINSMKGWAVSASSILSTSDGGETWLVQFNNNNEFRSIYFTDEKNGWAVGRMGKILKTNSGGLSSVIDENIPHGYFLDQNYPNPFNPNTSINYSIPKSSFVTIKVFDALGREINSLVNEYKSAGNYKVEFNPAPLTSGIYFYQMRTNEFIQTKKMILLR